MRGHLDLFEVRLTRSLSKDTLVLTSGSLGKVTHGRIVRRDCWNIEWVILLNLEVEHFQWVKDI